MNLNGINSSMGLNNIIGNHYGNVIENPNDNIIENPNGNIIGNPVQNDVGSGAQVEENPVFPQTDEPANTSELGGVKNLKDIVGDGSEVGSDDMGQAGSVDDKGDLYDMQTTAGLHQVVQKSLEGVKDQFLKLVKADEKIAALEKAIDGLEDGVKKAKLTTELAKLKKLGEALVGEAKSLTTLLSRGENEVTMGIVDQLKETEDQREARLRTEISNMSVSLRNFRSDFLRKINVKGGALATLSRAGRSIRNFFTTTRNAFFGKVFGWGQKQQYVHDNQWPSFLSVKDAFDRKFADIAREISPGWESEHEFNVGNLDQIGDYMDSVAEMIEAKSEDSLANMCVRSVKDQLRNIAENGGYKLMVLELGVGFGIHFTDDAEASVGVKGKYLYKVFSKGDGSVTIEHVGQGGADVRGKVRVGDILQVNAQGEAVIGGGKSFQYRDLDSAARSMISISGKENKLAKFFATRFNPLFIKGRGIGENIKAGFKYVFVALPWLVGMGVGKGMDKLHELRTGRHLFDTFDPAKQFRDRAYFSSLKDRGVLKQADKLLTPRKNILLTGERTFLRGGAGLGADVKGHVGPVRLRMDNSIGAQEDFKATKKDFRTYMTYLTNEQSGQCKDRVLSLMKHGESIFPLENRTGGNLPLDEVGMVGGNLEGAIGEVLAADVKAVDGGDKAVAKKILDLLRQVIEAEDEYGSAFEEQPEETKRYREAARDYRKGMLTTAALFEKFDELDIGDDAELKESYEKLRETATSHFENPAVLFPEEVFRDRFFTQHTTEDGKIVTKHEHFLEYDLLGDWKSKMLGDTALSDSSLDLNPGKMLGRAGAIGAVEGGSKALGLEGSVGVTVTEEVSTATDKKAPWLTKSHKTYDLQFSANASFDSIMRSILNAYCKEEGIPLPKYGQGEETGVNQAVGALASSLKRAFFDFTAKFGGTDPNSSIAASDKHFVNGGKGPDDLPLGLDFWRTGRTVQLEFFDGRLSAVNFGNGEKMSVKLGAPVGPVVIHGEYKFESQENVHSFWAHPSYDALLNKCDSMLGQGNRTMWKHFAQRNQAGLARMADVYVKQMSGESIGKGDALEKDSNANDDIARIGKMRSRIEDIMFMKVPRLDTEPGLAQRLQANCEKLEQAEKALAEVCAQGGEERLRGLDEHGKTKAEQALMQSKMLAMRTVLELTVRQFDILQSGDANLEKEFA